MDGMYGQSLALLQSLHRQGEVFMADIHADRHIYLEDPRPFLPAAAKAVGRPSTHFQSLARPIEVRKWLKKQPDGAWSRQSLRSATQDELLVEILHQRVWLWDKKSQTAHRWHLIVRREINSPGRVKYSLSNAPGATVVAKLAQMQAQRFWIERAFQDAKSHIGMAQYQARKWQSWHRHMALVMMAMQFMLQSRLDNMDAHPYLSCYDIQILLATTLPDRRDSEEEVMRQMLIRHQKRQAAMESSNSS